MEKNKDSNKQIFSKNSDTKIQNSQKNQDNSISSQLELQDYLNYFQNEEIQCPPKKTSQQESELDQENICQISIQKTVNQYQNNQKRKQNDSKQNQIKILNKNENENENEDEDILYTDEFIQPDFNNSYIPQELKQNENFMSNSQFQSQIEKNENPPLSSQRKPLNQDKQGDIQQYLQNKNKNQCDLIQYSDENNDCIFVQEDQYNQNNSQVQQTNVNQFQNSMKRSKNSEFSTTNSNNNMKKNKRIQSEQLGILNLNTNISPKNLNKNYQKENSEKIHQKSSKSVCSAEQFKQSNNNQLYSFEIQDNLNKKQSQQITKHKKKSSIFNFKNQKKDKEKDLNEYQQLNSELQSPTESNLISPRGKQILVNQSKSQYQLQNYDSDSLLESKQKQEQQKLNQQNETRLQIAQMNYYPDYKQVPYCEQSISYKKLQNLYQSTEGSSFALNQTAKETKIFQKMFARKLTLSMTIKLSKFLSNLKNFSPYLGKNTLTQHDYELIGDVAVARKGKKKFHRYVAMNLKTDKYKKQFEKVKISKIPVLYPSCLLLNIFDMIHLFYIVLALYYFPLEFFTQIYFSELYGSLWVFFITTTTIVFCANMLLSMNQGYYDKGELVMDRSKIIINYVKKGLFLDLLALLPLIESAQHYGDNHQYVKILNMAIFFKIRVISSIFGKYEEQYEIQQKSGKISMLSFIRLCLLILFVAHIFASIFIGISNLTQQYYLSNTTWIKKYDEDLINENNEWFTIYLYAFYWSTTTMTTVGFGDIIPSNVYEACFVTLAMYISGFIYAYTLNTIGNTLTELNSSAKKFKLQMTGVNRFLTTKQIERNLQLETRRYLQFKYESNNIISPDKEAEVLNELSETLKDKIIISQRMQLFEKCSFLINNFSTEFLHKLCLQSFTQNFLHDQPVFDEIFQELEPYLYIIESGHISIYTDWSNQDSGMIQILKPGKSFGEIRFIFGCERKAYAKSIGTSSILSIGQTVFLDLLQQYPEDNQKFLQLKDQYALNNRKDVIGLKCYLCGKFHMARECQKINYNPNRERVILQYDFSSKHIRSVPFKRSTRYKFNTKKELYFVMKDQKDYIDDLEMQKKMDLHSMSLNDTLDIAQFEQNEIQSGKLVSNHFIPYEGVNTFSGQFDSKKLKNSFKELRSPYQFDAHQSNKPVNLDSHFQKYNKSVSKKFGNIPAINDQQQLQSIQENSILQNNLANNNNQNLNKAILNNNNNLSNDSIEIKNQQKNNQISHDDGVKINSPALKNQNIYRDSDKIKEEYENESDDVSPPQIQFKGINKKNLKLMEGVGKGQGFGGGAGGGAGGPKNNNHIQNKYYQNQNQNNLNVNQHIQDFFYDPNYENYAIQEEEESSLEFKRSQSNNTQFINKQKSHNFDNSNLSQISEITYKQEKNSNYQQKLPEFQQDNEKSFNQSKNSFSNKNTDIQNQNLKSVKQSQQACENSFLKIQNERNKFTKQNGRKQSNYGQNFTNQQFNQSNKYSSRQNYLNRKSIQSQGSLISESGLNGFSNTQTEKQYQILEKVSEEQLDLSPSQFKDKLQYEQKKGQQNSIQLKYERKKQKANQRLSQNNEISQNKLNIEDLNIKNKKKPRSISSYNLQSIPNIEKGEISIDKNQLHKSNGFQNQSGSFMELAQTLQDMSPKFNKTKFSSENKQTNNNNNDAQLKFMQEMQKQFLEKEENYQILQKKQDQLYDGIQWIINQQLNQIQNNQLIFQQDPSLQHHLINSNTSFTSSAALGLHNQSRNFRLNRKQSNNYNDLQSSFAFNNNNQNHNSNNNPIMNQIGAGLNSNLQLQLNPNSNIPLQAQINMLMQEKYKNRSRFPTNQLNQKLLQKNMLIKQGTQNNLNLNNQYSNNISQNFIPQSQNQSYMSNHYFKQQSQYDKNQIGQKSSYNMNSNNNKDSSNINNMQQQLEQKSRIVIEDLRKQIQFPESKMDKVVINGFKHYFPLNNIENILYELMYKPKVQYRTKVYHLYARPIKKKSQPQLFNRIKIQRNRYGTQLAQNPQFINEMRKIQDSQDFQSRISVLKRIQKNQQKTDENDKKINFGNMSLLRKRKSKNQSKIQYSLKKNEDNINTQQVNQ